MGVPEIEELKHLIEDCYGKKLQTTTDFEEFSVRLTKKTGEKVSPSTLKRIWGYVSDEHNPRAVTLDALSRYIGHESFYRFTKWLKTSTRYNSSFFNAQQLVANDMMVGTMIEIGWSPNRIIHLRYLGNSKFEVVKSANSKLCVGDRFVTGCFIKDQPLYLPYIERNGEHTAPFVAGRNGGLTILSIVSDYGQQHIRLYR